VINTTKNQSDRIPVFKADNLRQVAYIIMIGRSCPIAHITLGSIRAGRPTLSYSAVKLFSKYSVEKHA